MTDQYTDAETGFQYLRARYYDPGTGQFLSRDPLVSLTGAEYSYVANNPLNDTDPLGLMCFSSKCLVNDVQMASVVVQVGADIVGIGAAAVGLEPVAGVAFTVAGAAGVVNAAATCASAVIGAGATGWDCAANAAITAATMGMGSSLGGPSEWSKGKAVFTQSDRVIQGGINLFGDLFSWARGYKIQNGPPDCLEPPRMSAAMGVR